MCWDSYTCHNEVRQSWFESTLVRHAIWHPLGETKYGSQENCKLKQRFLANKKWKKVDIKHFS